MTNSPLSLLRVSVAVAALLSGATAAAAQAAGNESPGLLDGLFGGGERAAPGRLAQAQAGDLVVRIDRLEAQIRQLTGVIEQLQYRNQQLAEQLQRMQEASGYAGGAPAQPAPPPLTRPQGAAPAAPPPAPAGRRSDAFDPAQNPNAPGAPRTLGPSTGPSAGANIGPLAGGTGVAASAPPPPQPAGRRPDAFDPGQNPTAPGAPRTLGTISSGGGGSLAPPEVAEEVGGAGGRVPGEPLNIHTMNGDSGLAPPGGAPPAEGRAAPGGPQVATLPPSDSPRDYYDLAYGYIQHKDYALAEDAFRAFLRKYPSDRMAPEAEYWLGESLYQRQRYRDAAEAFLNVSTKYESTAKAPDALLRLGTSLAALGEKEAACASLGEVMRKYPRAALGVRQGVEREQKRVGC
jgi:tol-pal system protein YbgF